VDQHAANRGDSYLRTRRPAKLQIFLEPVGAELILIERRQDLVGVKGIG
jgi:hypothetical protein